MIPEVRIFADMESLSRAAADLFAEAVSRAIAGRGRALVVISGGSTPLGLFRLLGSPHRRDQINWQSVHIFWADERSVPASDPESNYGQARRIFLDPVSIPEANVHRIDPGLEPAAAARAYAATLQEFRDPPFDWPRFDLVLLGMGDDGHTASLFPGSEVDPAAAALGVSADYQGRPANRVTLTPRTLNSARLVVFLVNGAGKAEILARVLDPEHRRPVLYPAQRIQPPDGRVVWMVERAAAGKLPRLTKT